MRAVVTDPSRRSLLVAGGISLLAIGAIQAMYGPAFPGLIRRFGIGVETVATTVVLHFAGAFATTAASAWLLSRFRYRPLLLSAAAAMAAGAATVAFAPAWAWVLAGALLGGLGFGLLNVGFNLLTARVFAPNAAPPLNLLSALFGIGAMVGPLAVGATSTLRVPFLAVAVLTVAAALATLRVPEPRRADGGAPGRVRWLAAVGFVLLYVFYVSAESGVAAWETVHLEPALGARAAAYMTSVYWGAITIGRLIAAPLSARVRPRALVAASAVLALVALACAHVPAVAPAAYVLAGLAFAPIFPTGLAWVEQVLPLRSERVVPVALALANAGPALTTAAIGAWVAAAGPQVIPTALTGVAGLLVLVIVALWWGTRSG